MVLYWPLKTTTNTLRMLPCSITNQQESRRMNTLHCKLHIPLRIECDSWHSWKIFSHTHRVSVTSDHPGSLVVVGVNFSSFSTSLKQLHGFASNFVWMFLGWTPTKFVKIVVLSLFFMELWVILYDFWPILKKSSSI